MALPTFTMPGVPDLGPLYLYAAALEQGRLDLGHLVSNGSTATFSLRQ